ncbi:MAG: hypothetical protein JWM76_2585 [Pseudonocardiales bacterium]|nr:hypothetical protein [Pseudonocardiales bacterium]
MTELLIPGRFNGPPGSANGGFIAGRMASFFDPGETVTVNLRAPGPLDVAMTITGSTDGVIRAHHDGVLIIDACRAGDPSESGEPVPPVSRDAAEIGMKRFRELVPGPIATCFVCGTLRADDDGMDVWSGPINDDEYGVGRIVASTYVPRADQVQSAIGTGPAATIGPEIIWSALDCPGGWSAGLPDHPALLARITGVVYALPAVGEECIVVGEFDHVDGRKCYVRSTAYGADGRELGRADALWIRML